MTAQKDLFGSDVDTSSAPMPTPVACGPQLTPQQQSFNRLIARIEKITQTLADRQQLADAHRVGHAARIEPLRRRQRALNRDMVFFLHGRLQRKGWTRPQKRIMKEILCALALPFIPEGDPEMLALHDQHGDDSFAEQHKAALAEAGAMMEDVLGVSLDSKNGYESVEEMLREGLHQAQDEAKAQQRAHLSKRHQSDAERPAAHRERSGIQTLAQGTAEGDGRTRSAGPAEPAGSGNFRRTGIGPALTQELRESNCRAPSALGEMRAVTIL